MRFGNFDVTEAQMCMMFVMMCSAMFGTEFWSLKLLGFLPLRWLPLVFATLAALLSLPSTVNKILFGGAGKNGSSVAVSVFDDIRIVLLLIKIIRASHPI
jgi:hypothetical protein